MTLTVIHGPMFARKTTLLLESLQPNDLLLKPSMDKRFSKTEVVTHDNLSRPCHPISEWPKSTIAEHDRILIDEIQFFMPPYYKGDIVIDIRGSIADGKEVVVAGLDLDWSGEPFPVTYRLLEMASHSIMRYARCHLCNGGARYTWLRDGQGDRIKLGDHDVYEARCRKHHPLLNS